MVLTTNDLKDRYSNYGDINGKITRDLKMDKLYQLKRGLYTYDININPMILCQFIYSPSYISFDTALSFYGLVPESTFNVYTSATSSKRKSKTYYNKFGVFTYHDVPTSVFDLGINKVEYNGNSYLIASAEKALCDKLYSLPPTKSEKELKYLLFADLRIDEDDFYCLDFNLINTLAPLYKSTNLNLLVKLIRRHHE